MNEGVELPLGMNLANVIAATEREKQRLDSQKHQQTGGGVAGQDIKLLITKWDEFVRYLVHVGGARSEESLKAVTLYDFMNWLRGQNV